MSSPALEPNKGVSERENSCRVVSLIYLSAEKKSMLWEMPIAYTIFRVDPTTAICYTYLRENKGTQNSSPLIFPCHYGCTNQRFNSMRTLTNHISKMHAAELWKACDREKEGWFIKKTMFPLAFACPFRCGAVNLNDPDKVETHMWIFHSSKPEEQEAVPENGLELIKVEDDGMQLGADAHYYYSNGHHEHEPRAKRIRLT